MQQAVWQTKDELSLSFYAWDASLTPLTEVAKSPQTTWSHPAFQKKKKKKNRHGLALGCCLFSIAETLVTNFRVDNHGDSVTLLPISKFVRTGQAITVGLCFYLLFKRSHKVRSVCCPKTINFNFINHQKKYINPRIYMMANYEPLLLLRTTSTLKELWFRKSECWEVEVLCSGPIWESSGLRSRELF